MRSTQITQWTKNYRLEGRGDLTLLRQKTTKAATIKNYAHIF